MDFNEQQKVLEYLNKTIVEEQIQAFLDRNYRVDTFYTRSDDYKKEFPDCAS